MIRTWDVLKEKIISTVWKLKKQGYASSTLEAYLGRLKLLAKHVNLDDPEAVKGFIARQNRWSNSLQRRHGESLQPLRYLVSL